jgi:hypothetical protein
LLKVLIEEFATYERLSATITEEQLRQDGFGTQPKLQVLIAEIDGQPASYALFFGWYSSFQGPGIFLGRPLCPTTISWEACGAGVIGARCSNNGGC